MGSFSGGRAWFKPVEGPNPVDVAPRKLLSDDNFQAAMLHGVSRTFALTIPQLPPKLSRIVSNAYLLCRIVDTIEDEPSLSGTRKDQFCRQFLVTLDNPRNAEHFSAQLCASLSSRTPPAEHELIRNVPRVIRITRSFSEPQREALRQCVDTMAKGMAEFQLRSDKYGLQRLEDLEQYCYFVAGVVGEMLTRLFCLHSPEIAEKHDALMALAVSFGQGLQMTNILKDVWEDYRLGACWLPQQIFAEEGFNLRELMLTHDRQGFARRSPPDRNFPRTFARCLSLFFAHSQQGDRDPQFLPLGNRARGIDAAQDQRPPRLYRRQSS